MLSGSRPPVLFRTGIFELKLAFRSHARQRDLGPGFIPLNQKLLIYRCLYFKSDQLCGTEHGLVKIWFLVLIFLGCLDFLRLILGEGDADWCNCEGFARRFEKQEEGFTGWKTFICVRTTQVDTLFQILFEVTSNAKVGLN